MKKRRNIFVAHLVRRYLFITGSWIYHQLVNLQRYKPVIITSHLENLDQFQINEICYYQQPFSGRGRYRAALRKLHESITSRGERFYINAIVAKDVRILHAHFGTEGYYNISIMERVGLPLVTTFYGADVSRLPYSNPKWLDRYRRLFSAGTLFLAEGSYMAQSLIDLGCPSEKVKVIHLGVDVNRIEYKSRELKGDEPVRILMASSFREKKGIPFGVRAFARAVRKIPNMELIVIGGAKTHKETKLMQECREIARQENLENKIRFLGYIPYHRYLSISTQAHVFLAPSLTASDGDSEGGAPVAIIEASASGMPILSTYHCDIPEVVIDGKSGLLVKEKDTRALTDALADIASSPDAWSAMGLSGRNHIENEYNLQTQVGKLERFYDRLIS